jgi:hypothetical protein
MACFDPQWPNLIFAAAYFGLSLSAMEKQDRPEPVSPRCLRCGDQPKFTTSMPDQPTGRTFHMFECQCGNRTWISEKV